MNITLPIVFEIRFLPPRCRTDRVQTVRSEVVLTLREVEVGQAPLVFRAAVRHSCRGWRDRTPLDYRSFDGHLWRRALAYADRDATEPAFLDVEALINDPNYGLAPRPFDWRTLPSFEQWPHSQPAGTILRLEDAHAARVTAQKRLDRFLWIVDQTGQGTLWERTGEPYLEVSTSVFSSGAGVRIESVDEEFWKGDVLSPGVLFGPNHFRLDQMEQAKAYLVERYRTSRQTGPQALNEEDIPVVEVFDPTVLRLNPQEWGYQADAQRSRRAVEDALSHLAVDRWSKEQALVERIRILEDLLVALRARAGADDERERQVA